MPSACVSCGATLSRIDALLGRSKCGRCRSAEADERRDAAARYPAVVRSMFAPGANLRSAADELGQVRKVAGLSETTAVAVHKQVFREALLEALADDILSEDEEESLTRASDIVGITVQDMRTEFRDLAFRLVVARVNDGRMPVVSSPHLMLKKAEEAHLEMEADLLKEVAVREWRGGYSGFSLRIAKGVRYHVGGARGRSVVVGTRLDVADSGILSVTSLRSTFAGRKTTIEMPHAKLLNLNVFTDGVQYHLSNRKNPPLFKVESGDVVAAVVNAAAQRLLD